MDMSLKLSQGLLQKKYFSSGATIYVSVSYGGYYNDNDGYNGLTGHYALIVGEHIDSFVSQGTDYYVYPADDSLEGLVYILVPSLKGRTDVLNQSKITENSYDGKLLHSITGLAIGLEDNML